MRHLNINPKGWLNKLLAFGILGIFSLGAQAQISSFPFTSDFGNSSAPSANWFTTTGSNPTWEKDYNGTTSTNTGPEQDNTNPGVGYY